MRNSWQFEPIVGIGGDIGIDKVSPSCNFLNKNPASSLALAEKGGLLTSPFSHTKGLLKFSALRYLLC
jgi:hypothetical protein